MGIPVALPFFQANWQEKVVRFFFGDVTSIETAIMVVILLSFLCNYYNLTLKLHQGKRSYSDEEWLFIGRFKVGSVPGISVALKASKESIKTHHEYDARRLIVINSLIYK